MLESTTYPGTTEEVVGPLLDAGSGLVAGRDYLLAYSPERIDPGNPTYGIRNTPRSSAGSTARRPRPRSASTRRSATPSSNARMPSYVVTRLADLLNDAGLALSRSKLLCLGAACKPDMGDGRESPRSR